MCLRTIAFLIALLFGVYGCGQDAPLVDEPTTPLKIGFSLAPGAPAQLNITLIELAVSTPDMTEPHKFSITDITEADQAERTKRVPIQVPVASSVTFSARAFEGECPVLAGLLENVEITPDRSAPINIALTAVQIVVGVRAEQDQLTVGSRYEVEVYIENAPELVALTCELEFDESLLEPLEATPGDFFGTDVLFIEDSEFLRREENRLSIGITLKGDAPGICGSGVVFSVAFRARNSGQAEVALLENVTLTAAGFEEIEDSSRIRTESNSFVEIE